MPSYMRGAHGILLVFDLTRAESFDNLPSWMDEIERWVEPGSELLVIANKLDQAEQRVITKAQCTVRAPSPPPTPSVLTKAIW